jgi:hypothetical protein
MAEIKGSRACIFRKDATDLVELLAEIVCRQLQEEAKEQSAQQARMKVDLSRECHDR